MSDGIWVVYNADNEIILRTSSREDADQALTVGGWLGWEGNS